MLALRTGAAGDDEQQRQLTLRAGGGALAGGCSAGVRRDIGGTSANAAAAPRPPPLRVSDPARFAAFLREAHAAAEAAAQREDAAERARCARDGDSYRTREQRAAAKEAADRAAADAKRRRNANEQQRRGGASADANGNANDNGEAKTTIRAFDASIDYYAMLGCEADAGRHALRKAYKHAALRLHPDKAPPGTDAAAATAAFAALQAAADVLLDKATREAYDAARGCRTATTARGGQGGGAARRQQNGSGAASSQAGPAAKAAEVPSRAGPPAKPAVRRVEAFVSLAACCTGGTLRVSVPRLRRPDADCAALRVEVPPAVPDGTERLFIGEGDGPETPTPDGGPNNNGDLLVVLRHAPAAQDAPFSRRGAKDVVVDSPLSAAPRFGDSMFAVVAPTPRGGAAAVAAPLLGALLTSSRCVEARVAREGLPDPSAPWHDAENGDLFVRTSLPPAAMPPPLRCALRPGAVLLLGDALAPEAAAAHAAVAAALHAKPGAASALRLRFRRAPRGGAAPRRCGVEAAACAGVAAATSSLTWRLAEAPLDDARRAIALLEDDWAALEAADVIVLHCPDEADAACDAALYAPPPGAAPSPVQLAVVHTAAVAQRAQPCLQGHIVGASPPKATVTADARYGSWVRLAAESGGGDAKRERWMLTSHPTLGRLLQPCGAGGTAALAALPWREPADGPPARLRVIHAPKVAVRAAPATSSAVLDVRRPGDELQALAACARTGWAVVPMPKCPGGVGFLMLRHPDLGPLVEVVPDEQEAPPAAPKAAAPDAEAAREAAVRALCGGAHACGLAAALQRATWRGALLVAVGGAGAALLGAAPGRPPRDTTLPYVVRQSDDAGGWAPLERCAATWPSDTPARGLRADEAAMLPPLCLWAAEAPEPTRGWAAECSRDGLRRGERARKTQQRAAAERAEARAAISAAAAREAALEASEDEPQLRCRDGAGVRRGACAAARCAAFARPSLRAAHHAALLLTCAACGAAAADHVALI